MTEQRKVTVELDEATVAFLDRLIEGDRYSDAGEAVRHGLALLAQRDRRDEAVWQAAVDTHGLDRLRALVDEGVAAGEPVEATDALFEDVKRRGRERLSRARAAE